MVNPSLERTNIIIVGKWNISILSPNWLGRHILVNPKVNIEVPLTPGNPFRITGDDIILVPEANRLVLQPAALSVDNLIRAESMAIRIMEQLPHTPVSKFGINIGYDLTEIPDDFEQHFPFPDVNVFADNSLKLNARIYTWSFDYEDHILNLKSELSNKGAAIDFNFHHDCDGCEQAIQLLTGKCKKSLDKAKSLMSDAYGLSLEET